MVTIQQIINVVKKKNKYLKLYKKYDIKERKLRKEYKYQK